MLRLLLVGEQPGDQEDISGKPFVGPAGKLLDKCLAEAGIDRKQTYVTNMVKHFKWEPRGKRRLHEKPNQMEISACKPWLEREIEAVQPKLIVALGATAAQGLMGSCVSGDEAAGQVCESRVIRRSWQRYIHHRCFGKLTDQDRERETQRFIADLKKSAEFISSEVD